MTPSVGSQKRSSRLASVVLPEPEGPTSATVAPGRMSRVMPDSAGALCAGIGETDVIEADRRAVARRRRRRSRTVGDQDGLVMHHAQPVRRGEGIGELAADMGDLRDRQEGRDREQREQRQKAGSSRPLAASHAPVTATQSPPIAVAISSPASWAEISRKTLSRSA